MKNTRWIAAAACAILLSATASAHHAFVAEFDANKPIKCSGTVTKFEWTNPHAWVYLDVKDENGNVTSWSFEMGSPNQLIRQGWRKTALKEGDQVTIEGYAAKDGSKMGNARNVIMPDGHKIFAGSQGTGAPAEK